jgi:phosphoribosylamine--glycine ligase
MTLEEAHAAVDMMLSDNAGRRRRARGDRGIPGGEEASFIVMCDGKNILPLATSQDHKRLQDTTRGPTPAAWAPTRPPHRHAGVHARVMREIILPTVQGMAKDGIPFTGFLYAGLMIDAEGNPRRWNSTAAWATRKPSPSWRLKTDLVTCWNTPSPARWTRSSWNGTAAPRWAW